MRVIEPAFAKINLFLDVVSRREDGYHNIVSLMQAISLSDTVTVCCTLDKKSSINISSNDKTIPTNEDNIVYRVSEKYLDRYNIKAKVDIDIEKSIPVGAGLGGGSTDGAATLRALNRIFCSATREELMEIAAEVGSDIPFCLVGGRALCTGRGEIVEPISEDSMLNLVVAIGKERVSTPAAYKALDEKYNSYIDYVPVCNLGHYFNAFECVTNLSEIEEIKEIMTKNGAEHTLMTGSGPAVFSVFADKKRQEAALNSLKENGFTAFLAESVGRMDI